MARENMRTHLALVFVLAIAVYAGSFALVQHLRARRGGWQITFRSDKAGVPSVGVAQPRLNISNVVFSFPNQPITRTNLITTIVFDQPITNIPFGRVVYLDTTFLPGSIVLDLFGHEIQLLPRILMVEGREIPWQQASNFQFSGQAVPGSATSQPGPGARLQ